MSQIEDLISYYCPEGVVFESLDKIAVVDKGKQLNKELLFDDGEYPVLNGGVNPSGYWNKYNFDENKIAISQGGASAGFVNFVTTKFWAGAHCYVVVPNEGKIDNRYLFFILKNKQEAIQNSKLGAGIPGLNKRELERLEIPIPPLEVQEAIVKILDTFTALEAELEAELEARQTQYEHYRNELLAFGEDVEWKALGDIATNLDSKRMPITKGDREDGVYPYYGASGIVDYVYDYIFDGDYLLVSEDGANLLARVTPIAFSASGKIWVNNHAHVLEFKTYAERKFVEYYLNMIDLGRFLSTAAQPKLTQKNLNKIPIPAPTLHEQERIVAILDKFDALVNGFSCGLPAEIEARRKQYEYYRDKLLTFKPLD